MNDDVVFEAVDMEKQLCNEGPDLLPDSREGILSQPSKLKQWKRRARAQGHALTSAEAPLGGQRKRKAGNARSVNGALCDSRVETVDDTVSGKKYKS